jgi:hypothetical protein
MLTQKTCSMSLSTSISLHSYLGALALTLFSGVAVAQESAATLPNDEELKTWDAKFRPGLYKVQEFDLDKKTTKPNLKTVKEREQCLTSTDMSVISRAPVMAVLLYKQCLPVETKLSAQRFAIGLNCVEDGKQVVVRNSLDFSDDQSQIYSESIKAEFKGKTPVVTYAKGTTMTFLGACTGK